MQKDDSLKESNIITINVPPFGTREIYYEGPMSRHYNAARCHSCRFLYDPYDSKDKCPRCGAVFNGDIDKIAIPGQSMWCECCGRIMTAFWQDYETECGFCGAKYMNTGRAFSLKSPGTYRKE